VFRPFAREQRRFPPPPAVPNRADLALADPLDHLGFLAYAVLGSNRDSKELLNSPCPDPFLPILDRSMISYPRYTLMLDGIR